MEKKGMFRSPGGFGLLKMIKIMRNTIFILLISLAQTFAANSYSQQTRLSLNMQNARLEEVIDRIEKNTEFFFLYNKSMIDVDRRVDIVTKNKNVQEVLDKIFAGSDITYSIKDRQILLINNRMKSVSEQSAQQQKSVTGKVTDTSGSPLPGVSVVIKGTTTGIITDMDGIYRLTLGANAKTLVFSFVGMKPVEVSIEGKTNINVVLEEETFGIEEVVAVGYGTQKKVNLTGAVAAVDAKKLENRPVTNVSSALQGLMPGATVIQNSGQPGKDMSTIRIRGVGTLNNADPMYVVDGVVVSSINDIDPNDIESISILKDAASAAIYGSRASNGVVLVTTKKGTKSGAVLKYDGYLGVQTPTNLVEYLPSWEYAKLFNQGRVNQGQSAFYSDEAIQKFKDGSDPDNYPNTDWLGLFYKKNGGIQQSHRAELSGGSDNTKYLFSVGYFDQDGIIKNAGFKRYNARTNVETTFNKITASLNLAFTYGSTTEPTNPYTGDMYQIFRQINRIAPFVPYKYSNGYYGYINDGNPLAWMDLNATRNEQYRKTRAIGNVAYEPLKGLKIHQVIAYEYTGSSDEKFIKDIQYYNWKTGSPSLYQGPNSQTDKRTDDQMVNLQTLITYDKIFGKHTISVLAGYSQEYYRTDWNQSYRKNFLNNSLSEINAGSTDGQEATGSAREYGLESYFGRVSYNYDSKYLLEANVRYDGTSRIASENRWGTFPSFSAAWRVINEPFMDGLKEIVSDLKIRAGWGILGNQNLPSPDATNNPNGGFYPYQQVLSSANYPFGGTINPGVALVNGVNTNLRWESSQTTNAGIDFGFLSNKVTFSTDVYRRHTYDILMLLPVPTPYGLSAPFQNVGEVVNKGVEFQLGYRFKKGLWKFDILANAAYNKNEIANLDNDGARIWSNSYSFRQEGYPVNSFGGYIVDGLFRNKADLDASAVPVRSQAGLGDFKYRDIVPDKKITAEDRTYLGSWTPAWTFGTTINVNWKNFDLQLFFQGAAKVKGYLQNELVGAVQGNTTKPTTIFRDAYDEKTNPNGNFPRPLVSWTQNSSATYPSSYWVVDASYLRLKNIQLGYTIPSTVIKTLGISRAKIYYSGQNLLTISGLRKGFDPEAPAAARAFYPQVKTNSIGLSVTF